MSGGGPGQHSQLSEEQQGQSVKPDSVQEKSFAASVADLVHDVMPQSSGSSPRAEPERIDWVSFHQTDLNDPSLKQWLESTVGSEVPLVVVMGLARGYQIWALMSNGDCEELVSDRQGPVKTVKFLPEPLQVPYTSGPDEVNSSPSSQRRDRFVNGRPLLAVCDSVSAVPGRQHCSLSLSSLATGDVLHSLRFEEPVCEVDASRKALVIAFAYRIIVFDALSFSERFSLKGCRSEEYQTVPFSLADDWLAFADTKLSSVHQSCGGVAESSLEQLPAYATHVMSAAKNLSKTIGALGESVANTLGAKPSSSNAKSNRVADSTVGGILSVIDISQPAKTQGDGTPWNVGEKGWGRGLIAHFPALPDEPVGKISLQRNPSLCLVVGDTGHCFQLFSLCPHPGSSALGAAHHLYTLFRGSTPARVVHTAFSLDTRWLALTTNHGTAHIFPITPYGGVVNNRSHGGPKLVNKESIFFRSAGLDSLDSGSGSGSPGTLKNSPSAAASGGLMEAARGMSLKLKEGIEAFFSTGSVPTKEVHPSMSQSHLSLSKVAGNPRLPPYPSPTVVTALGKIHQQFLGTLSSWTPDISTGKKAPAKTINPQACCKLAVAFGKERGRMALKQSHSDILRESLFVMNSEQQLVEYSLSAKPVPTPGTKVSEETPVELVVTPTAQWTLQRTKSSPDLRPPLPKRHPLMFAAVVARRRNSATQARLLNAAQSAATGPSSSLMSPVLAPIMSPTSALPSLQGLTMGDPTARRASGGSGPPQLWLSQVEMITYTGPSRRLWTGPQFSFRTYVDPSHSATDLVSPDDYSDREGRSEPMAMPGMKAKRFPSTSSSLGSAGPGSGSLLSMPIGNQSSGPGSFRSVPVVIEASSGSFERRQSVTMEVCGSWSDNDYITVDEQEGRVREGILDAMQDFPDGAARPTVTLASNLKHCPPEMAYSQSSNSSSGTGLVPAFVEREVRPQRIERKPIPTPATDKGRAGGRLRQESQNSLQMEDARSSFSDSDEEEEEDCRDPRGAESDEDSGDEPNFLFPDLDSI